MLQGDISREKKSQPWSAYCMIFTLSKSTLRALPEHSSSTARDASDWRKRSRWCSKAQVMPKLCRTSNFKPICPFGIQNHHGSGNKTALRLEARTVLRVSCVAIRTLEVDSMCNKTAEDPKKSLVHMVPHGAASRTTTPCHRWVLRWHDDVIMYTAWTLCVVCIKSSFTRRLTAPISISSKIQ